MPRYCRFTLLGKHRWGSAYEGGVQSLDGSPYDGGIPTPSGELIPPELLTFDAPATPSKIICVGRNYADHAKELGNAVPEEPLLFFKPPSALLGHEGVIRYPSHLSQLVHHEVELAVVMGRTIYQATEAEAEEAILGYTILNDVTARDIQRKDGQFFRGKGFDTFCPMGPWLDTDFKPADQRISLYVNDELRQDGHLSQMIFSIPKIISYVSQVMTLERGDIIATGTPSGVGELKPGDQVRAVIEGLGELVNTVV